MGDRTYGPAVTVSATYGAGGSIIAPRLAEELGVPYIDRLILAGVKDESGPHSRSRESMIKAEEAATPSSGGFLSYFARVAAVGTMVIGPDPILANDDEIRSRSEAPLKNVAQGSPAVVLGRAGAVVLAGRPRAYHIRLDGAVERRQAWAADHEGITKELSSRRQADTDRARTAFVKSLYRTDPADPALYHLVLDTTVLGLDDAVDLLLSATRAFLGANP